MASWGVPPPEVARRFSEEAFVELGAALIERRARESVAYQLATIAKGLPGMAGSTSTTDAHARVHKYPSGRTSRTYGSASHPLTGPELEAAVRDIGRRVGNGRMQ